MPKHTEQSGDGGPPVLHHGRRVGTGHLVPTRGFLSQLRAAIAVLGFLLMAWMSRTSADC